MQEDGRNTQEALNKNKSGNTRVRKHLANVKV